MNLWFSKQKLCCIFNSKVDFFRSVLIIINKFFFRSVLIIINKFFFRSVLIIINKFFFRSVLIIINKFFFRSVLIIINKFFFRSVLIIINKFFFRSVLIIINNAVGLWKVVCVVIIVFLLYAVIILNCLTFYSDNLNLLFYLDSYRVLSVLLASLS